MKERKKERKVIEGNEGENECGHQSWPTNERL